MDRPTNEPSPHNKKQIILMYLTGFLDNHRKKNLGLYVHYLRKLKLLTYGHQICTAGAHAPDVDAPKWPNDRFVPDLTYALRSALGQNVKFQFRVNRSSTNRNRCTQRLVVLHAQTHGRRSIRDRGDTSPKVRAGGKLIASSPQSSAMFFELLGEFCHFTTITLIA